MIKIIEPSYEILDNSNIYKLIEIAGRLCYKSEDKITDDSYTQFITNILKRKHYSVLEHGQIVMFVSTKIYNEIKSENPKYLNFTQFNISGNVRAWIEFLDKTTLKIPTVRKALADKYPLFFKFEGSLSNEEVFAHERVVTDFSEFSSEESDVHKTISVRFIHDRAFTHELVRHRPASYSQESQRYVNYGKADTVTFIKPIDFTEHQLKFWNKCVQECSENYLKMIDMDVKPQYARSVLPNSTKTEIIITATVKEWKHIFSLRCESAAHPEMRRMMIPLQNEMISKKLI